MRLTLYMAVVFFALLSFAAAQGEPEILRISAKDRMAVVKAEGGRLRVVKPGDKLPPFGEITEISENRIISSMTGDKGPETVIIKITKDGQSVTRISEIPKAGSPIYTPVVKVVNGKKE